MKNSVDYNQTTKAITINFVSDKTGFEFYDSLLDWLGDNDIVQANELSQNLIAMDGQLYDLDDTRISQLKNTGSVELVLIDYVKSYKDTKPDFYNWYYQLS